MSICSLPALAQVNTQWVKRYNGPGNGADIANALAVDKGGNVYVTGQSRLAFLEDDYATIKYKPDGDTAWVRRYDGGSGSEYAYALVVDDTGNVYVTGYSVNYATIKYAPNGDTAWARRYDGPGLGGDGANVVAVDDSGNVYVTGTSFGSGTADDYATIKYKANGDTVWVKRYNGPGNDYDGAYALVVDSSGHVYVTGRSFGNGTDNDYATIKYMPNGDTAWVRRYNGPGNGSDVATGLAVDASGNVYVTGYSTGLGTAEDIATVKYTSTGDTAWVRTYNGPGNGYDAPNEMILSKDGFIYVTGSSFNGTTEDYVTIRYTPGGDTVWTRRYNGPGDGLDRSVAMAIDDSSNVYVTGRSYGGASDFDYATLRYNPDGDLAWVIRYNGPGNGFDRANSIAVDDSGNVYVTGESDGSGTVRDYATIKYVQFQAATLNVSLYAKWNMVSVPVTVSDYSKTVLFPTAVSSAFWYGAGYEVAATLENRRGYWVKFPAAQTVSMTGLYRTYDTIPVVEGWNMIGSLSTSIPISSVGSIPGGILTGNFYGYNGSYEVSTSIEPGKGYWVKVSEGGQLILSSIGNIPSSNRIQIEDLGEKPPLPPNAETAAVPETDALDQNYPNPFNPETKISYAVQGASNVSLVIYDVLGREVARLVHENKQRGEYSVSWNAGDLPGGVYFCKLVAGEFAQMKKMVLMK